MVDKIIKADPRIRLDELNKIEKDVVEKIHDLERKLKLQLIELETTRELINEMKDELAENDAELFSSVNLDGHISKLEDVLGDFESRKDELGIKDQKYLLRKEDLEQVTSNSTIARLYDLAKKDSWSSDEAKELAGIKYNLGKAMQEEFNPLITDRINSLYDAVKTLGEIKPETVKYDVKIADFDASKEFGLKNVIKYKH
jgi:hypothetical protein